MHMVFMLIGANWHWLPKNVFNKCQRHLTELIVVIKITLIAPIFTLRTGS